MAITTSIKSKLLTVLLVPSILAAVMIILDSMHNYQTIKRQQEIADVIALSEGLSQIAHNFAVERGLSAGFLGSKGANGREKLDEQRLKADKAAQFMDSNIGKLRQQTLNKQTQALLDSLSNDLAKRNQIRSLINELNPNSQFFGFYSGINAAALQLTEQYATRINDAELQASFRAYSSLLWLKERAGQARGALNGVFASGQYSAARASTIQSFIADQNKQVETFRQFANESESLVYANLVATDAATNVEAMRKVFTDNIQIRALTDSLAKILGTGGNNLETRSAIDAVTQEIAQLVSAEKITPLENAINELDLSTASDKSALVSAIESINRLEGVSAQQWFAQATARIISVNKAANQIKGEIINKSMMKADDARQVLLSEGILGSLVLLFSLVTGYIIARRISLNVKQVQNSISSITNDFDFSIRAKVNSKDEIGQMARTLNHLLTTVKESFDDIERFSQSLAAGNIKEAKFEHNYIGDLDKLSHYLSFAAEQLDEGISDINLSMQHVRDGDFNQFVNADMSGDLAVLKTNINNMLTDTKSVMSQLDTTFGDFAKGQLTNIEATGQKGLFKDVVDNANVTINNLRQVIEKDVQRAISAAGAGQLNHRIQTADKAGCFKSLSEGINQLLTTNETIVSESAEVFQALSHGKLNRKLDGNYLGAYAELQSSANKTVDILNEIIEEDIDSVVLSSCNGDLSQRIQTAGKHGAFLSLSQRFNQLLDVNSTVISEVGDVFAALARGNLSQRIDGDFQGEFAALQKNANQTIATLNQIVEAEIDSVVGRSMNGDLSGRVDTTGKQGFFLSLSDKINRLLDTNEQVIGETNKVFAALAQGDLNQTLLGEFNGSFALLQENANKTIAKLKEIVDSEIAHVINESVKGRLDNRIDVEGKQGFFLTLSTNVNQLFDINQRFMSDIENILENLAKGDLSVSVMNQYKGSFAGLIDNANRAVKNLRQIILNDVQEVIEQVRQGNLSKHIDMEGKQGCFELLSAGINEIIDTVDNVFVDLSVVLEGLENGDLSNRVEGDYKGSFDSLKRSCNQSLMQIGQVISKVNALSTDVQTGMLEISQANGNLSARTESQAASVEETASSINEISSSSNESQASLEQTQTLMNDVVKHAQQSEKIVNDALVSMQAISDASRKIEAIISVIDDIAFQTNLLALNASVEAARAGEDGRGFNVVAGEVRNLAQRSASSASEIKELINDSVIKVEQGTLEVKRSSDSLGKIIESIDAATGEMNQVVQNTAEQVRGIHQIDSAINLIDEGIQQNSAMVEQVSSASAELAEKAQFMKQAVSFFQLDDGPTYLPAVKQLSKLR